MRPHRRRRSIPLSTGIQVFLLTCAATLHAQVVRDGSIGPGIGTQPSAPNFTIPANYGESGGGKNLFHSFRQFDLQNGQTADFISGGADNILARVTGGTESSINGRISANANLFLMNPAGIVFHENATINVTGSFFATTADYIKLGEDGRFGATLSPSDRVLTSSDPAAFGFLTPNPKAIRVASTDFGKPELKTLGLIGGDVTVENGANLVAEDVQIVGVRSAGEATLQMPTLANGLRYTTINAENFSKHGAVTLGRRAAPNDPPPIAPTINANRVVIRGGTLVATGAQVVTNASQAGDGLHAKASESITVEESAFLAAFALGDVRGVDVINLNAPTATLSSGAFIGSGAFSGVPGGNVHLTISGRLTIDTAGVASISSDGAPGGNLLIDAGQLEARGSAISTTGALATKGGDIRVNVSGAASLTEGATVAVEAASGERIDFAAGTLAVDGPTSGIFADNPRPGPGNGAINLNIARELALSNGGMIRANSINNAGDGASIDIRAGQVSINGESTGISAQSHSTAGGRGGSVRLSVEGNVNVLGGGVIDTNNSGTGGGGTIDITAANMTVSGLGAGTFGTSIVPRGVTSQNLSAAGNEAVTSGDIRLTIAGTLQVTHGGEILVSTHGAAHGGNLQITAHSMEVVDGGQVSADTRGQGRGGTVTAIVDDLLVSGQESRVAAISDAIATGSGGNISIDSKQSQVTDGGVITAATFGAGAGGSIFISGNEVLVSGMGSQITATSGLTATGAGGSVGLDLGQLRIRSNGQVTTSTLGAGAGGNVQITADQVFIEGSDRSAITGISAQSLNAGAGGAGGNIQIDTAVLKLAGEGAAVTAQTFGSGNGGSISVSTGTLSMQSGSSIASSSSSAGAAGSVKITAQDSILLNGGSSITVASAGSNAGDIRIRAGRNFTINDSSITAEAALNGGNIDLRTRDLFFVTNGQITAAAGMNGGNIFIDPIFVVLDNALISANAIAGRGGNIRIISDFFLASPGSLITATSELGIDGTVRIDALNTDLTGSLVELPSTLLNAESLLQELCSVKVDHFSSFISEGRGGLPPLPGEALPSLMIVR